MIISINQVEYTTKENVPTLHIFGRDKHGVAHRVNVHSFRPYFYVEPFAENKSIPDCCTVVTNEDHTSIRGEKLVKILTNTPTEVRDVRANFKHHEADVLFPARFLIDTGIKSGMEFDGCEDDTEHNCFVDDVHPIEISYPARVCIADVECDDTRGFPDSAKDPILCITCYDSFDEQYITFLYSITGKKDTEEMMKRFLHRVCVYDTERKMLEGFAEYLSWKDPDILTGWNFTGFDAPYIFGRMAALRMRSECLARFHAFTNRVEIKGRQLFDLLAGYKRMHLGEKESYRLDAIAKEELGRQKVRFPGKVSDLWRKDPAALVEYNLVDVELCVGIDKKDETIEFHRTLAYYVGCTLDKTLNSMPIIDTYLLRKAYGKFVLPSKGEFEKGDAFEGATVFPPIAGVHENVAVLDLTSLYPMIMLTINASPETKDLNGELRAPNGVRFKKAPDGLTRSIINELFSERKAKKAERAKYPFGSYEYKLLDMQQNVIKVLMNSYYGVSGNPAFRNFDNETGAAVTSVGRAILEHNRKIIDDMGYKIVMGDTDSTALRIPKSIGREGTMSIAYEIEKMLNDSYPKFAKEVLNADVSYFSIKFEKLYERFFSGGKKKRYAGLLVWKEGKDVYEIDIVGFETKRSDSPKVTRQALQILIKMVLEGNEYQEIRKEISEIVRKYRKREYSLDDIGIPGGIGKALSEYETKDAQIRGAEYSNEHLGTNFGKGSKPKRIYLKSVPSNYQRTDVLCFEYSDQVPDEFVVDIDVMLRKTLEAPLTRILQPLGWNWTEFDPSTPTLSTWGFE